MSDSVVRAWLFNLIRRSLRCGSSRRMRLASPLDYFLRLVFFFAASAALARLRQRLLDHLYRARVAAVGFILQSVS